MVLLIYSFNLSADAQDKMPNDDVNMTSDALVQPFDPYYINVSYIADSLDINNGYAQLSASVLGQPSVTKITGTAVLSRVNANGTLTQITSWTGLSATGNNFTFGNNYYVTTGYTYRFTLTITATANGVDETVSGYRDTYAN